ncbi:MAG: hypothetical protein A2Y24_08050 [Clostridiales bacterium GWE2_32_10]|nr:MAG: hypothetical protein A2Y24_08050 [Clostridiales bacterium GWE2_32_10]
MINKSRGFTLLEITIGIAIFAILSVGILESILMTNRAVVESTKSTDFIIWAKNLEKALKEDTYNISYKIDDEITLDQRLKVVDGSIEFPEQKIVYMIDSNNLQRKNLTTNQYDILMKEVKIFEPQLQYNKVRTLVVTLENLEGNKKTIYIPIDINRWDVE